jgi:peptidoglycan hydrolase-like protein with peptidoglycan-binding domain
MVGIFQIHSGVHTATAKKRGIDIMTPEGNSAYARFLYEKSGTDPWISSFSCWSTRVREARIHTSALLTADLHFGHDNAQVVLLQELLNQKGYTVSSTGPGSPGSETTSFGILTRKAVRAFQCAEKIACGGDEYTTGYGFVDEKTRVALRGALVRDVKTMAETPAESPRTVSKSLAKKPVKLSLSKKTTAKKLSSKEKRKLAKLRAELASLQIKLQNAQ